MKARIIALIEAAAGQPLTEPDADLIESGVLDSLAFIELLDGLEQEFGVEIQPTQVSPEVWRKLDGIVALVEKLTEGR